MRKRIIRYSVVILLILLYIGAFDNQKADAKENKVSKITLKIGGDYVSVKRPRCLEKAKRVKVKCSKKSIVKVKYLKNHHDRRLRIIARKKGTVTITIKCLYRKKEFEQLDIELKYWRKEKPLKRQKRHLNHRISIDRGKGFGN